MNPQLIESASWRIVTELVRRYPDTFVVVETHPAEGMYNCLSLFNKDLGHAADFNRYGYFRVFGRFDGVREMPEPLEIWPALINAFSPKEVLDRVADMLGLPHPPKMPASTPATMVYRFISAALGQAVFGVTPWECHSGMVGTLNQGIGIPNPDLNHFPGAVARLATSLAGDFLGIPAFRFWLVYREGKPVVCLETTGTAWDSDGKAYELYKLYAKDRRIWPLVWQVMGQHLG